MRDARFLDAADRIGARLCRDAVWAGNRCNWLGWALEVVGAAWSPVFRAQTPFIYDGTAGIALFLARLYRFTEDEIQKAAALGALNRSFAELPAVPDVLRSSVYSGGAGIVYAAIEVGEALGDEKITARAIREFSDPRNSSPGEGWLDIIGGSAGAIQVLLDVARRFHAPQLIDFALEHGRMLLRMATKSDSGWSWDTLPGQGSKHLLGYGHGAAGIGCALLELWAETGEREYREAALQAFRYERSHFSKEHHNWPDLRSMEGYGVPANQPVFAMAWCHGGPGIGLARLRAGELLPDEADIRDDLNEALDTTRKACSNVVFPASGTLCLCHGLGGNADLLINAADLLGREDLRLVAEGVGQQAIAQIQDTEAPWPCGVNGGGETPNLMLGLAGIGHFYLRLYDSARVPSILLFRPGAATGGERESTQQAAVSA